MIYTVTLNPSIDYIVQVDDFSLGNVNRSKCDFKYPGGKGINVSRVLNNIGIKTCALGFIGGFTGEFVKGFLEKEGVYTDFINVAEDTRINVKIKSSCETELNGTGPNVDSMMIKKLYEKIEKLKSGDFLILSGNIQKSLPKNMYENILEKIPLGVKFVVDTTGDALMCTISKKPFLVKPNIYELGELFNVEIKDDDETVRYANKLIKMGAENVIVSLGKDGAILVCKDGVYRTIPPKGILKNSVGAGDSMIAGFIGQYSKEHDLVKAFKYGSAAGSATAFSIDLCTKEYVDELFKKVTLEKY